MAVRKGSGANYINVRGFSLVLTAAAGVVPLFSLMGWLTGVRQLASYGGHFIPMAPSTALGFILISLPLFIMLLPGRGPVGNRAIGLAGGLVAVYGFLVALAWFTGLPLNPDDLLFKELGTLGAHRMGRMSPATGILFTLCGVSVAALVKDLSRTSAAGRHLWIAGLAGFAVMMMGAVFSVGYALGAPLMYASRAIPVALPTAISFLLLSGALTTAAALTNPGSGHWYQTLIDMPIGLQMRLGLTIILAFVILLGTLSWRATDLLWLQTKNLYEHPYQVRRAIGQLEADGAALSRHVRDLVLARDDAELAAALQRIELKKADAMRWFPVLSDRYLGHNDDLVDLQAAFAKWNALRSETIRLLRTGKRADAEARIRQGGVQELQAQAVRHRLDKIDDFARNMGDSIYRAARAQNDALNNHLAVTIAVILLLTCIISWQLLRGIKEPLSQLTTAAEKFRRGELEARSGYVSANEFGTLSAAFNTLADTVATQMRINAQESQFTDVILRHSEARLFCVELLNSLMAFTGSQIGAVYLLNPSATEFEHFASIGLAGGGRKPFSVDLREGEFGAALATGRMQRIADIAEDTRFTFAAVSGQFRPREIITIPLLDGEKTVAMISLAGVRSYPDSAIRLLESIQGILTARMNGVLAFRQIQAFAEQLQHQNRELETQKQELTAQANELTEMNTELGMQQQQLQEANRHKSAFLSKMSHELRTPLNSVIALSGVLNRRLTGTIPETELGYLDIIERNGKQLLSLINDILDLSRVEAGHEEVRVRSFSMRMLIGEVVAMLEPQASEKGIDLTNQVTDDLPSITSDPDKCRHILQNLLANAVKFTDAGRVAISVRPVDHQLHVAVRDTGIGIAADQLTHIFEEFRQVDDGAARRYGGTGLGLAIARKYATLLHGEITVQSAPGQGSTFTLKLPLLLSQPDTKTNGKIASENEFLRAGAQQNTFARQGHRILLVEDSEPAVIQMTDILSEQGYGVRVARNGHEALAQMETAPPDAMILDLMMPEMDGFEVLRKIRASSEFRPLPVLILTAKQVTPEELSLLRGNHIHQLIQKGDISRAELLAAVARMVAPPPAKPALATLPRGSRAHRDRPAILVVEDNPDNLQTMRALLEESYTILEADNGRTGAEQARRHLPDLILMDLALPVMDGYAALAEIRQDEALRHIPVVAVTASAMMGNREEILTRGFDGYLAKPVDAQLLRNTLQEMLNGKPSV
jgi:signal transduction histidine kinase/response regulator RpfG family c-di-GMP phosphodiesterase/HAMP domain-containing protein